MEKHGVFISHRHEDWLLAGRIYDFLNTEGLHPFLDAASMRQSGFPQELTQQIQNAPYFLCVLTKNTFVTRSSEDFVYREIEIALSSKREILLVAEEGFQWPQNINEEIAQIKNRHYYTIGRETFLQVMRNICDHDIQTSKLVDIIDWRTKANCLARTYITSREKMESQLATLNNRFGADFIQCVRDKKEFTGENRIKFIHMSCYAASVIFCPSVDMVDERAFDLGMMFNTFAYLLKDEHFSMELVINAPGSFAAQDAINNEKLGNSALEEYPEAVFLSSYASIQRLIQEDPIFTKAYRNKRFRFMVTDNALPYSIFQIEYKQGYEENNHIKVDLYSEGLTSNMDRRCMVFFKKDDPENYDFFVKRYEYIRNVKKSKQLIAENHNNWIGQWTQFQGDAE